MAVTWKKLAYEGDVLTKAAFDAHSIMAAVTAATPTALDVAEQTLVGRITGGDIAALTVAQVQALLGTGVAGETPNVADAAGLAGLTPVLGQLAFQVDTLSFMGCTAIV
jgi:hypothetical protein